MSKQVPIPIEQELSALFGAAPPRDERRMRANRARFITVGIEAAAMRRAEPSWWQRLGLVSMTRRLVPVMALVIALLGGARGASANSLPGDPAYPIKRAIERVEMLVIPAADWPARLDARRQQEVHTLIERGREAPTAFGGPLTRDDSGRLLVGTVPVTFDPDLVGAVWGGCLGEELEVSGAVTSGHFLVTDISGDCLGSTAPVEDPTPTPTPTPEPTETPTPEPTETPAPTATPEQAQGPPRTPPGQTINPPGPPETPPGQGGEVPGPPETPPGQEIAPPGPPETPPGQGGDPPGQGPPETPPGQGGDPPGQGPPETPPGQGGDPPGPPETPPGQGGDPPGQGPPETPPGPPETPPGQGGDPPGQGPPETPPGQGDDPPGRGNRP